MSDAEHHPQQVIEGLEYTNCGGWSPAVWNLIRWLRANSCSEYAYRLEQQAQSVSPASPPAAEAAALTAMREELAVLYNSPPAQLTPQHYTELSALRRRATRFVQYRLRMLAEEGVRAEQAVKNLWPLLEKLRQTAADGAEPSQAPAIKAPPADEALSPALGGAGSLMPEIDQEAQAIALLFQRPDLSLPEIARAVGVGRQALYKWPRFLRAAEGAGKYSPKPRNRGKLPHGSKSTDGTLEAWRDPEDE